MMEQNNKEWVAENKITVAQFIEKLKQLDQDKIITYDYGHPIAIWDYDNTYTIS